LSDLSGFSTRELAIVAAIFFAFEIVTGASLTYIMDTHFSIPMLSASPREGFLSKEALETMVLLAFMFTAMNACIAMAASVEL